MIDGSLREQMPEVTSGCVEPMVRIGRFFFGHPRGSNVYARRQTSDATGGEIPDLKSVSTTALCGFLTLLCLNWFPHLAMIRTTAFWECWPRARGRVSND